MQNQRRLENITIYWTEIIKIVPENEQTFSFYLKVPEDYQWKAGSFVHWGLEGFDADPENPNRQLVRHMSIASHPSEGHLMITTRIRGDLSEFKRQAQKLQVGDRVAVFKTIDNIQLRRNKRPLYFLSQGVGIAALRAFALEFLADPSDIPFIHSMNVDRSQAYLFQDIFQNSEEPKLQVDYVKSSKDYYQHLETVAQDLDGEFYIIGSDDFIRQTIDFLSQKGIPHQQMSIDKPRQFVHHFLDLEAVED